MFSQRVMKRVHFVRYCRNVEVHEPPKSQVSGYFTCAANYLEISFLSCPGEPDPPLLLLMQRPLQVGRVVFQAARQALGEVLMKLREMVMTATLAYSSIRRCGLQEPFGAHENTLNRSEARGWKASVLYLKKKINIKNLTLNFWQVY